MKKIFALITIISTFFLIMSMSNSLKETINVQEEYKIMLDSREFTPNPTSNDLMSKSDLHITKNRIKTQPLKRVNVIVQFNTELSKKKLRLLNFLEIDLLRPINDNKNWIVSVPVSNIDKLVRLDDVRWIGDILYTDKIDLGLQKNKISSFAINKDNSLNLEIGCYENIEIERCKEIINNYGIIQYKESKNSFLVKISKGSINDLANQDVISFIGQFSPKKNQMDYSRLTVEADIIQISPYQLNGSDILIAMWEAQDEQTLGYKVNRSHKDLINRVTYGDAGSSFSIHATMVADILAGDGSAQSSYMGIAKASEIINYDIFGVRDEHENAVKMRGATISQNSWADTYDNSKCDDYGNYDIIGNTAPEDYDDIVRGDEYPNTGPITIVFANGNERGETYCNVSEHPYNSTPMPATAKNVISVGAIYSDSNKVTCFSSFGPTDDGRIKPDIVAPGDEDTCGSNSTHLGIEVPKNPTDLWRSHGTSLAAPLVSGTVALMQQQFNCSKPYDIGTPLPSTIKALLIHTATDINNTGPDYATGWGLLNSTKAIDYIIYRYFKESNITDSDDEDRYNFTINDSSVSIKVTLVWDDKGGKRTSTKHLWNDLDLTLISPNGTHYKPYVLNPANPSAVATTGRNFRDNIEQVVVNNPAVGTWIIVVNASSLTISGLPQKYSLIYKKGFEITLKAHLWNLISFPVFAYEKNISKVFKDLNPTDFENCANPSECGVIFVNTNASLNGWISFSFGDWAGSDFKWYNQSIGKGLWIGTLKQTKIISIEGDPITDTNVELFPGSGESGVNYVAYNSFKPWKMDEAVSSISNFKHIRRFYGATSKEIGVGGNKFSIDGIVIMIHLLAFQTMNLI